MKPPSGDIGYRELIRAIWRLKMPLAWKFRRSMTGTLRWALWRVLWHSGYGVNFANDVFYFNGIAWSGRLLRGEYTSGVFVIRRDDGNGQPLFTRLGDTVSEVRAPTWRPPAGCPGHEADQIAELIRELSKGGGA